MPASGRSPPTDFCVDPAGLVTDSGMVGRVEVTWTCPDRRCDSHCITSFTVIDRASLPSLFTSMALWSLTVGP